MAKVLFKRIEDSANINNIEIEDGSFIVTGDGKTYVDYGEDRIPTSGTPDTEMSDRSRNTVENNVIKEYVDTNFQSNGEILWANPNPTNNFSSQTITLSSDDYDELTFFYKKSNNENKLDSIQIIKGYDTNLTYNDSGTLFSRAVTHVSDTSYQFNDGKILLPGSSTAQNDNSRCVPIYIIGYKTGLFS